MEGGIPVKVIAEESSGWLKEYLKRLLRFALLGHEVASVRGYAHDESYRIKFSYRTDAFVDLCAELATEVAKWRTIVESEAPPGIDSVSFLDAKYPSWKDSVPIYFPIDADSAARSLLTGLISEQIDGLLSHGIGCERYLAFQNDAWRPAIRIQATGEIPIGKLLDVSTSTRWRATPYGELAEFLPSQIALFEPPAEEQNTWRIRPLADLNRLIVGFPLSASVSVTITSNNRSHIIGWPNGQRVNSDVLVFNEVEPSQTPTLLRLVKTGSASLPSRRLFVLVPEGWTVEADEGALGRTWCVGNRKLFEIFGTCYFSEPELSGQGRYRIQAASAQADQAIEISARTSPGINSSEACDIFESPVSLCILKNGVPQNIGQNEVFVRRKGETWRPLLRGEISDFGMLEVSWRDPKANIQIEKRHFAVVPAGASVRGVMTSTPTTGRIALTQLPGWSLRFSSDSKVSHRSDTSDVQFEFGGRPNYRIPANLVPPKGAQIPIIVPIVARDAVVLDAYGEVVQAGRQMDLASYVAHGRFVPTVPSL